MVAEGPNFKVTWGLLDHKLQTTVKVCEGKNLGKSNQTTPEQQAVLELEAEVVKRIKEGYSETKPDLAIVDTFEIDLNNLPKQLCPSKPSGENKLTEAILNDPDIFSQRKRDGNCLILVRGTGTTKVYSRRMDDLTPFIGDLPIVKQERDKIPMNSFVLYECTYFSNQYQREMPRFVATVVRKEDSTECLARYNELSELGTYEMVPLDCLFMNNKFVGDTEYSNRAKLLAEHGIVVQEIFQGYKEAFETAKKNKWEGLILRVPGEKSHITYTLDGKPKRAGAYKKKCIPDPEDFVVDAVYKGISGKQVDWYVKFHLIQYDENGKTIDRGHVGAGILTHDELKQLTEDIDSGKLKIPFVIEVEFQSKQEESGKLEFGQPQRLRPDKSPAECVCDD